MEIKEVNSTNGAKTRTSNLQLSQLLDKVTHKITFIEIEALFFCCHPILFFNSQPGALPFGYVYCLQRVQNKPKD